MSRWLPARPAAPARLSTGLGSRQLPGTPAFLLPDQADFSPSYSLKALFLARLLESLWVCSELKCIHCRGSKPSRVKTAAFRQAGFQSSAKSCGEERKQKLLTQW